MWIDPIHGSLLVACEELVLKYAGRIDLFGCPNFFPVSWAQAEPSSLKPKVGGFGCEVLLGVADKRLYKAEKSGRNQVSDTF
jgi:hypothetical protein